MTKSLTTEDLKKLTKIVDDLLAVVRTQEQLKSLLGGSDNDFVKEALSQLEIRKKSLYEKGRQLMASLK